MRKFKSFMASVLTYLMLISLIPSSFTEMITKASENEYVTFVKSGYYLKGEAQYGNETLVAYGIGQEGDTDISIVKNGKETFLKKVSGYTIVMIYENGTNEVGISYGKFENDKFVKEFEKFNFITKEFTKITNEEFEKFSPTYENGYEREEIDTSNRDIVNKFLQMFNDKYNLDLNINEKEYLEDRHEWGNINGEYVYIDIYQSYDNLYSFTYIETNVYNSNENREYRGLIYNDNVYLRELTGSYDNIFYSIVENNSIYIWEKIRDVENKYKLIKLKDGKEVSNGEITLDKDIYISRLEDVNDKIYMYNNNKLYVYQLSDGVYKNINIINSFANTYNELKKITLEKVNDKIYLSNIVDGKTSKIVDVTKEINDIYKENNYISLTNKSKEYFNITTLNGFILVQKKVEEVPIVPENPSDDEVVTPPVEDNNGDGNQDETNKPSEDTLLDIPLETLKPNEVTEVVVKSENTTNFNLILKDIETIKDGEGSLKAILNNVTLNLPFSVVDKDLIGENDTVSVKLDVLSDSKIIKDLKAVNKVFDFNLVVNKEGESVNIHNFKDGVAEITFALSDVELEGLNKDKLVVYYYNEETGKFEAMETKVDANNVTFKTSHFSKYVIAEEIVDNTVDKPEADKDESVVTPDNDDEVVINPDKDDTTTNDTNNTTNNEQDKTENVQGQLPTTGSVVSNNTILVLALGAVLVGGVMAIRKKRVA